MQSELTARIAQFRSLAVTNLGDIADLVGRNGWPKRIEDAIAALGGSASVADLRRVVRQAQDKFLQDIGVPFTVPGLAGWVGSITAGPIQNFVLKAVPLAEIQTLGTDFKQNIDNAILNSANNIDALRVAVMQELNTARSSLDRVLQSLEQPLASMFPDGLAQAAGTTLRFARAFGDAPLVDGMAFSRSALGYFYDPLKAVKNAPIDITPAVALVNRVGGHLKALGVSLPTGNLLDQVLPAPDDLMKQIDFGKLLPDFAGIKLDSLLPDLKAPSSLSDKVKITHDFDKQSGKGWVQADVQIDVAGPSTLFDGGPLRVALSQIDFTARIRIDAGPSGAPRQTQNGKLSANWDLTLGGNPLVTFVDTSLTFDESGRTKFNLDPTKIQMNGLLEMLSKVLQTAGDSDSGFTLRLKQENGLPVGVEAILKLPLPALTFGACSLSNLTFGAEFELVAVPEFAIGTRVHVAEKTAPFTLAILLLGGGGWLDARGRYLPLSDRLTTSVSVGINAGAILAISFGPVKGSIFAFFFVEGELRTDSQSGGNRQLIIRIGIILGGDVDVCGIISVCIRLLLELEYSGGDGSLIGRGMLSIRVKVCIFLTISFSQTVEKKFAGSGGGDDARVKSSCKAHIDRTV